MKKALKSAAYLTAPKAAFTAMHPRKAAMVKAGKWAMNRVRPQPKRPAYGMMALKGIGAAALALPVGMWLGRRARGDDQATR